MTTAELDETALESTRRRPADRGVDPRLPARRSLTLAQLSELSGVSVGHLSRLENGTRTPTVRLLLQLARALGVSLGHAGRRDARSRAPCTSPAARTGTRSTPATPALQSLSDPGAPLAAGGRADPAAGSYGRPGRRTAARSGSTSSSGAIEVDMNGSTSSLETGDAIHFRADVPHSHAKPPRKRARPCSSSTPWSADPAPPRLTAASEPSDETRRRRPGSVDPVRRRRDRRQGRGPDRRMRGARRRSGGVPGGLRRLLPQGHGIRCRRGTPRRRRTGPVPALLRRRRSSSTAPRSRR